MVGKEPFFSLLTSPSTWTDLSKESGVKWSDQTAKQPSGLKCALCVPTKAFHFERNSGRYIRNITASLHNTTSRRHAFTRNTQKKAGEQFFRILFLLSCGTRTTTLSLSAYQISHVCLDFVESLTSLPFSTLFLLLHAEFCSSNNGGRFDHEYTG